MDTTSIVSWTSEPQTRGTVGLIWSCVATIFLCTWNAVHPNVPAEKDSPWRIFWRRVIYMLVALVAPEFICGLALEERWFARAVQAKFPGRSLAQCFFLTMGGFVVNSADETVCLRPEDVMELLETKGLSWPDDSLEKEILDRSKADWVLKSLALVQATWFIAQIIGRAAQGLSVTTLELFALGIISCSLFTYVAWWSKPFDIRSPTALEFHKPLPDHMTTCRRAPLVMGRGDAYGTSNTPLGMTMCISLVFGALHLVGWQFHFPTELEKWLWRASSVACITLPVLLLIMTYYNIHNTGFQASIMLAVVGVYAFCRMYMLVEMFISLRAVPTDVYRTPQWSQYFPSFG